MNPPDLSPEVKQRIFLKVIKRINQPYMEKNTFAFLTSARFWQLFLMGVSAGLADYSVRHNWLEAVAVAVNIWLGGSVIVRTTDRITESKGSKP